MNPNFLNQSPREQMMELMGLEPHIMGAESHYGGGGGGGSNSGGNKNKKPKPKPKPSDYGHAPSTKPTKVQQRFKDREAKGLDGHTGQRKVTESERKQGKTQLTQYRESQKKQVQDAASARNQKFNQTKVQTLGGTKTNFTSAEKKRIESAGYSVANYSSAAPRSDADVAAAKAETTRKSMFSTDRLTNPNTYAFSKDASNISASFASPSVQNWAATSFDKASSWYNKGRLPNESKMSIRNLFNNDLKQQQQIGKFNPNRKLNWASYARGESNPFRGMPGYGTITGQGQVEGGFQTGPTPSVRQAIERPLKTAFNIGKFIVNPKTALLASNFRVDPLADGTLEGKPTRFNIDAGGLNIGDADSGEAEGSGTGRTVVTTDKDKNINYDVGGIVKDVGLGLADFATFNKFDFDNLGRPSDNKSPTQKFETFKKSPLQQAILSKQLGIDAKRLINEGGPAAESLMKNYISQIDSSSAKGIRNPIAKLLRDTAGENQTDATAMAGRAISAFSVDDPNFSNKPNALTKALEFAGIPQLSGENVQDIRHTLNKNVTEDTGIPGKGLTNIPYSQALGLANRITAGKIKDGVEESLNQLNIKSIPTLDDAVALGSQFKTNMETKGTVTAQRMGELKTLYDKYGPGKGQAPTTESIIRGILPGGSLRSGGGNKSAGAIRSSTGSTTTNTVPEEFIIPELPQVQLPDLQNIQQQAYNQQMSIYGSPNYSAQFRPVQNVRPLRRRQYFNRDYFTQFA